METENKDEGAGAWGVVVRRVIARALYGIGASLAAGAAIGGVWNHVDGHWAGLFALLALHFSAQALTCESEEKK